MCRCISFWGVEVATLNSGTTGLSQVRPGCCHPEEAPSTVGTWSTPQHPVGHSQPSPNQVSVMQR